VDRFPSGPFTAVYNEIPPPGNGLG